MNLYPNQIEEPTIDLSKYKVDWKTNCEITGTVYWDDKTPIAAERTVPKTFKSFIMEVLRVCYKCFKASQSSTR